MGQFWHIWKEAKGEPLRDWAERIPHSGILRYLDLFNSERIVVLSPEALSEVLVTRSYDFIKPSQLAKGLGRILGIGLFLAEGEEHKVNSSIIALRYVANERLRCRNSAKT